MPAYNASHTIKSTFRDLPHELVDEVIVVDDNSTDDTIRRANRLGIEHVLAHDKNLGYGANQKTCYRKAMELDADIIVMVHPDYQYDPRLVGAMVAMIASEVYDCVIGSRILASSAIRGGMPVYKYVANRVLTLFQNLLIPHKLSEYHSGFRAFSKKVFQEIDIQRNSNDFLFDNQLLLQIIGKGFRLGEISCPAKYDADSSSINFRSALKYGLGVIRITIEYKLAKLGMLKNSVFS